MEDDNKKRRAAWLKDHFANNGFNQYGLHTEISKKLGCSMSSVQGWFRGSLPRDMELADRFCEAYQVDMLSWIRFRNQKQDHFLVGRKELESLESAIYKTKQFEESKGGDGFTSPLTPRMFVKVFRIVLKHMQGDDDVIFDSLNFEMSLGEEEKNAECR